MRLLAASLILAAIIIAGGRAIASASTSSNFRLQILPLFTPPAPNTQIGGGTKVSKTGWVHITGIGHASKPVFLMIDGKQHSSQLATKDGHFDFSVQGLNPGSYVLSARTSDATGNPTPFTSTNFSLLDEQILEQQIILAPTLIARNENNRLHLWGEAPPSTTIVLDMSQYNTWQKSWKTEADAQGRFELWTTMPSNSLDLRFTATAWLGKVQSATSWPVDWAAPPQEGCKQQGDLNRDCYVDLKDFSIALFWYQKPLTASALTAEKRALNGDGRIDLQDFSIIAYFWNPSYAS